MSGWKLYLYCILSILLNRYGSSSSSSRIHILIAIFSSIHTYLRVFCLLFCYSPVSVCLFICWSPPPLSSFVFPPPLHGHLYIRPPLQGCSFIYIYKAACRIPDSGVGVDKNMFVRFFVCTSPPLSMFVHWYVRPPL